MSKVISGRGKIHFHDEKDREKMDKKYPEVEFEKMNPLTFTTTYKGKKQFDVEIQVQDTKILCSMNKWAEPWKYGTSKLELRLYFKDLKKKATTHITGGIQSQLFKFFRYDYEKMMKDNPQRQKSIKLNAKISKLKTKQKKEINAHLIQKYGYKKWAESLTDRADSELLKEYNKILKNPDKELEKIKKNKKKGGAICWPCLLPFTIPSKRKKGGGKKILTKRQMGGHRRHCVKVTGSCDYHLKCKDDKSKKWEYMKYKEKYKPDHCKKTKKKKSKRR